VIVDAFLMASASFGDIRFWRQPRRVLMHLFGNLGHVVILFPTSLGLIGFLVWSGARRDAFAFAFALMVCLATTLLAKLAFQACGDGTPTLGIQSPSGHASFSATVYGCLAILLATGRPIGERILLCGGATLLALFVGLSRVFDEVHTSQEVGLGLLIGFACSMLFFMSRVRPQRLVLPTRAIALSLPLVFGLAAFGLLLGRHWTPEPFIESIASKIGAYMNLCV
jgi:membrane-associated phospholipid phosphatase